MPALRSADTTTYFRESGNGPRPPLFCIHGAGSSSASWLGTLHRLGAERRKVAIDLPGHGRSTGASATFADLLSGVGNAAAHLCLGRSVLVGHSMGGLLALAAALQWPDKVAGLVLCNSAARLGVSSKLFARIDTAWNDFPAFMAEMAYSPDTPRSVRERSARIALTASQAQTRADFEACMQFDAHTRLGEIAVPTLVITGAHDLMVPSKWGEALAAGIPGATRVHLEHTGHFPMHEAPDRFVAVISSFLDRIA